MGDTLLNPILVVEVLSPSTERLDRGPKFQRYRSIESLQEYLLVSQDAILVERFARQPGGEWLLSPVSDLNGSCALSSIPATLKLSDIYENALPDTD